ncbi:MAG: Rne/Rng family ribonuclease, partial [Coriobacteriia bacterium]|nr:Rne/Rng family ribonuclease [Coriobacteriia bacterium]
MAASMLREMLISQDFCELRVALCEDKQLVELYVQPAKRSVVGNIYLGKVSDVLPGMQAAFVDIGLEQNAYLSIDDLRHEGAPLSAGQAISRHVQVGQTLMVQVVKDATDSKGARVTMELSIPGRFLVLFPNSNRRGVSKKIAEDRRQQLLQLMQQELPAGMGAIARSAAQGAAQADIQADIALLMSSYQRVKQQSTQLRAPSILHSESDLAMRCVRDMFTADFDSLTIDDQQTYDKVVALVKRYAPQLLTRVRLQCSTKQPLFSRYGIEDAIAAALKREVPLPSGGSIVIDQTEALVSIDVNTGSFIGSRTLEETLLTTNLEAAEVATRQMRLRDVGGIIIIDFIDM